MSHHDAQYGLPDENADEWFHQENLDRRFQEEQLKAIHDRLQLDIQQAQSQPAKDQAHGQS
jgi:hypothetical protein